MSVSASKGRAAGGGAGRWLDVSDCVVLVAGAVREKAVEMLVEEVEKRSGVRIRRVKRLADAGESAAIVMATRESAARAGIDVGGLPADESGGKAKDGYALQVDGKMRKAPTILAIGNDSRGVLFAVGRLLREMRYRKGKVEVPANLRLVTAPMYPLRGHQLGYRPRNNTWDRWNLKQFEQYIRDFIVWGANAIELIPPIPSYDNITRNVEFYHRAWEMNAALSKLIGEYGLEVHVWVPVDDEVVPGTEIGGLTAWEEVCPSTPAGRKYIMDIRRRLFSEMPNLDGVFVPASDPGGCHCDKCKPWGKTLLGLCEEMAQILAESHPKAKIWIANTLFSAEEDNYLCQYLEERRPDWLAGLVFGPLAFEPLPALRRSVPAEYQIRFYPDITHSARCQYPVIDWDHAYFLVEGREVANPRPLGEKHIHNLLAPYTCGSISYSDGAHDDVNKVIWSALDWDPSADMRDVVLGYGRYFIGEEYAEQFADGIFALERNWEGPLADNESVEESLRLWQRMEAKAPRRAQSNWRFQLGLFRAYLDAYVQQRLLADMKAEKAAYAELRKAEKVGLDGALVGARKALARPAKRAAAADLRQKVEALAGALNESICMKLGSKYGAEPGRADILDDLDEPLNNGEWLTAEMGRLLQSRDPEEKRAGISRLLHWDDPGPGGFYDDLGNPTRQPHLVYPRPVVDDPGRLETVSQLYDWRTIKGERLSSRSSMCAFRKGVLALRYAGLDPEGRYAVRVTYPPHHAGTQVRLVANARFEVHPMIDMPQRGVMHKEFEIPAEATRTGRLDLIWEKQGGRRIVSVAEVWLIKQPQ